MRIAIGLLQLAAALGVAEAGETGWRFEGTRVVVRAPEHLFCFGERA